MSYDFSNIDQAIEQVNFYSLGLSQIKKHIKEASLQSKSIKKLIQNCAERFGEESLLLLPYIKCEINNEELIDVLESLVNIPLIKEAIGIIKMKDSMAKEIEQLKKENLELLEMQKDFEEGIGLDYEKLLDDEKDKTKELESEIIKLKKNQAPPTKIFDAIKCMNLDKMKEILKENPDLKNSVDQNDNAKTPICVAAKIGWLDGVKLLFESGADINSTKTPPIMWATANKRLDVVKFLVKSGARVDIRTQDGFSPLHIATVRGFEEIVKELVNAGADVNLKDYSGNTSLKLSKHYCRSTISAFLRENGGLE